MRLLLLFSATSAGLGCTVIDRAGERAFLRGHYGRAIDALAARSEQATNDYALEENLLGTAALVGGDYRTARRALLAAGQVMGSFPGTTASEIAALVGAESNKFYLGDPYEVAMNSLYLGLVFLRHGDTDNALAAFKQGIIADASSRAEEHQADNVELYLLASMLLFHAGSEELAQQYLAQVKEIAPEHPFAHETYLRRSNTVIVVDVGDGPRKIGIGPYGHQVAFDFQEPLESQVSLRIGERHVSDPALGVDIGYQAATRGRRALDTLLAAKAGTKIATEQAGLLIVQAGVAERDSKLTMIGTALLFLSALIQPQADLRHWHLLPGQQRLWIGRVQPGLRTARLDFATAGGRPLPAFQQIWHHLPFHEATWNVYYFRAAAHKGFRRSPRPDSNLEGNES
ncbi:MAG: hypothetical protein AAF581_05705 [Planctomycetota bacterium]